MDITELFGQRRDAVTPLRLHPSQLLPPFVGEIPADAAARKTLYAPFGAGATGSCDVDGDDDDPRGTASILREWRARGDSDAEECDGIRASAAVSAPASRFADGVSDVLVTCTRIRRELDDIKSALLPRPPSSSSPDTLVTSASTPSQTPSSSSVATRDKERKILISFNGGKDCVVILHLLAGIMSLAEMRAHCVFFVHEKCELPGESDELPEAVAFRDWLMAALRVDFHVCRGATLSEHLWRLVRDTYRVSSVLLGTRRTDPSGAWQTGCLSKTTSSWPPDIVLVSPVFSWTYDMVWEYTLRLDVPRCALYDRGFTSLGHKADTVPNRALRLQGELYEPAWRLADHRLERDNRRPRQPAAEERPQQQQSSI